MLKQFTIEDGIAYCISNSKDYNYTSRGRRYNQIARWLEELVRLRSELQARPVINHYASKEEDSYANTPHWLIGK